MKTIFGILRDHTGSMGTRKSAATNDYNQLVRDIKSQSSDQDIIVNVIKCGTTRRAVNTFEIRNSSSQALQELKVSQYDTDGSSTPLFDAVGDLIVEMERSPDADKLETAFVVMVVTDGEDNASRVYNARTLANRIQTLQSSDRWTFVFRVPVGSKRALVSMGIPADNILEWELSSTGLEQATQQTSQAMTQFFQARSVGQTSTKRFYADLSSVSHTEVKAVLTDISKDVTIWPVSEAEDEVNIRDFVEQRSKQKLLKGAAFYQLSKGEDKVGKTKKIIIRDKTTNSIFYGAAARDLIGLPRDADIRLSPKQLGDYDVFIQSTSVNRKLRKNTQLLYWPEVGVKYKEGISA